MNTPIKIARKCKCLKGSPKGRYDLKKGQLYMVNYIYQDPDGDFMAEIVDGQNWTRRCYASRFAILTP